MSPEYESFDQANSRKQEIGKKERMSDIELGNLVSAIGNHEAKAFLMLAMQPNRPYTSSDLYQLMRGIQRGADRHVSMHHDISFQFCKKSLYPIGLVAEEITLGGKEVMYQKTDYGSKYGDAVAGHLLDFSEKYSISLSKLFGNTSASAKFTQGEQEDEEIVDAIKRAPHARYQIFQQLLTQGLPLTVHALNQEIDISSSRLSKHMDALNTSGLIDYQPVEAGDTYKTYELSDQLSENEVKMYKSSVMRTDSLLGICRELDGPITSETVFKEYRDQYHAGEVIDESSLRHKVGKWLKDLSRKGYLKDISKFEREKKSIITLDEGQRKLLTALVSMLDRIQDGDEAFLEEGRRKGVAILSDPQKVVSLLQRARENSSGVKGAETRRLNYYN